MEKIAIYPGSFDPLTNGHLDILKRALKIFDKVIIAVMTGGTKNYLFSDLERLEMLRVATAGWKRTVPDSFKGLLVDYAREKKAIAIIRGLRAVSDFEYELQMGLMNRRLSSRSRLHEPLETVYLMPDEKFTYLSSTMVKEIAQHHGIVKDFVPEIVEKKLKEKIRNLYG